MLEWGSLAGWRNLKRQICCDNFIGWHVKSTNIFKCIIFEFHQQRWRTEHRATPLDDDFVLHKYCRSVAIWSFIKSLLIPEHVIGGTQQRIHFPTVLRWENSWHIFQTSQREMSPFHLEPTTKTKQHNNTINDSSTSQVHIDNDQTQLNIYFLFTSDKPRRFDII